VQAVHLKADGVLEILIGDARQSQRPDDNRGARQDHGGDCVAQTELAQKVRVLVPQTPAG